MRNSFLISVLLVFGVFGCSHAQKNPGGNPLQVDSIWKGKYTCPQGETDLDLKVLESDPEHVLAVFEFSHSPSGAKGSFYLHGKYDSDSRELKLTSGKWINRPFHYLPVDMDGKLSEDLKRYEGVIPNFGCGAFSVTKSN